MTFYARLACAGNEFRLASPAGVCFRSRRNISTYSISKYSKE